MKRPSITIISGGQTGADRAALDFAIEHHLPHGGWCPRGRLAEDGPLDDRYQLRETKTSKYDERTRRNIEDSDGTVVFSPTSKPTGGTQLTLDYARRRGKRVLHLVASAEKPIVAHAAALQGWIATHRVRTLNVAGPRESQSPGIGSFVTDVLRAAFINK
ncbi:MAG: putative molybdenum carrier protein [Planctomycetota bacterium]